MPTLSYNGLAQGYRRADRRNPFNCINQKLHVILDGHPKNQFEQMMPWICDQASGLSAWGFGVTLALELPLRTHPNNIAIETL